MASLGIPERAGFWVGGKSGRLMHGDAGAIAARIEQTNATARALRQNIDEIAVLLANDAAPQGEASDVLRARLADATKVLDALDAASRATIAALVGAGGQ